MSQQTRRDLIKAAAVTATAAAAGVAVPPSVAQAQGARPDGIRWDKGVCRFCGTGCGVLVGVKDGRVVATQGDPDAPVNRGLNCVKGYFLSKIMYGEDRLTRPLLRMKDGKFDKNGEFTPITWDAGLRDHGREVEGRAEEGRPVRGRHVRLGPVDDLGRLCGRQAVQGRLPHQQPRSQRAPLHGLGGRRLHAHLRHRRADGLLRRPRARRRVRAVGLEHGGDASDPVVAPDRPAAHPQRLRGARALHLRAPLLRARRQPDDLHAADRSRDPQLHRQLHHPEQRGEPGFRRQARRLRAHRGGHRLRAAARPSAGGQGGQRLAQDRQGRRQGSGRDERHQLRAVQAAGGEIHARLRREAVRRRARPPRASSPSSTPIRRRRSCPIGPWGSTSTRAAPG